MIYLLDSNACIVYLKYAHSSVRYHYIKSPKCCITALRAAMRYIVDRRCELSLLASFHFVPFAMTDLNETVLRYSAKRCNIETMQYSSSDRLHSLESPQSSGLDVLDVGRLAAQHKPPLPWKYR